ncbi:MAG TPA: ribonuclease Y [Lentisphaeria bacterium]|nr:MAG: ribonuclease Y [Lentisphaerae bacterium GWF2_49_21]HBC87785.1 ribonuclease Y [Lentisphaeria bacterium]
MNEFNTFLNDLLKVLLSKSVIGLVSGMALGFLIHWLIAKFWGQSAVSAAEKVREDAKKEAEHILREAKVAAKSELLKIKDEFEVEAKDRKQELISFEKRLIQREDILEKKADVLDGKMATVEKSEKEIELARERVTNKEVDLKKEISKQITELERIAELTRDSAKEMLLEKIKGEVQNETGHLIRNLVDEAKEKAEKESQKIMIYAMQKYASECAYEHTTATIPLPNDEMKGRIIGRDGRNIRAIEAASGVTLMIDDTPEAVVISCFDPVKKETARLLLEKLISDGRIHPTRIEELYAKAQKEVEDQVFSAGEAAVLETGMQGINTALVKLLGRLKFRFSYSQNVLRHSVEAAYFMGIIAAELGLDVQKAKRIGLLHDIGKAMDHEIEGSHASIGADILRKNNEAKDVINAVAAHHEEVEKETLYAVLVSVCDALSASRPGARSETADLYLKRLDQLEKIACEFTGVESCYALQAGREVRVIVQPGKVSDAEAQVLARDVCQRIEKEMNYPGQIKVTVIRETRCVDYAK